MNEATYVFERGEHRLTVVVDAADEASASALLAGPIALALVVEGPALLVLVRLRDGQEWSAAAFSWHFLPPRARVEPVWPLPAGAGAPLRLRLVGRVGGPVVGERRLMMPPGFATLLHGAIRHQARGSAPTRAGFERAVDALIARHTGAGLLTQAIARATL